MRSVPQFLSVIALIAVLPGCGTPPKAYVEPASGPSATITFVSESGGTNLGVVRLLEEPAGCACSQYDPEVVGVFFNKAILVPGSANYADKGADTNRFTVRIPTDGKPFRFMMGTPKYSINSSFFESEGIPARTLRLTYCQAHHAFDPQPGKHYEAVYNTARDQCSFEVFSIESEKKQRVQVKSFPMCALKKDNSDGISDRIRAYCAASPEQYK